MYIRKCRNIGLRLLVWMRTLVNCIVSRMQSIGCIVYLIKSHIRACISRSIANKKMVTESILNYKK